MNDHDERWKTQLILPLFRLMRAKGIEEIRVAIKDGKGSYLLIPVEEKPKKQKQQKLL